MKRILIMAGAALVAASCLKKDDLDFNKLASTSWAPEVGLPLIDAHLTPKELFANTDSNVLSTPGGLVTLTYKGKEAIFPAASFMDMSLGTTSIAIPVMDGNASHGISLSTPNGEEIKKVTYTAGTISLKTSSLASGNISITFPNLKKGGNTVILNTVVNGGQVSADITGAVLEMTPANVIAMDISISGSTPGLADLVLNFEGAVWSRIEGDFKNRQVDIGSDTMAFHLFKNVSASGKLELDNPKLKIKITNGLGIPFKLDFNQFQSVNSASGEVKNFAHNLSESIAPAHSSGPRATTLEFNRSNSQIRDLIKPTPSFVYYEANVTANPSGAAASNFVDANSNMKLESEFVLPLSGAVFMSLKDTVPVGVVFDYEEIQGVSVRISSENGFPFDARLNLVLFDENQQPIMLSSGVKASLVSDVHIFKGAGVDGSGIVNSPTTARVDIGAPKQILDLFSKTKFIEIEAALSTTDDGKRMVQIREDYFMDVKVGVKIIGKVKI
jgi:hypothetical protein